MDLEYIALADVADCMQHGNVHIENEIDWIQAYWNSFASFFSSSPVWHTHILCIAAVAVNTTHVRVNENISPLQKQEMWRS